MSRAFQVPVEFDPQLIERVQREEDLRLGKSAQLREELGLSDDETDNSGGGAVGGTKRNGIEVVDEPSETTTSTGERKTIDERKSGLNRAREPSALALALAEDTEAVVELMRTRKEAEALRAQVIRANTALQAANAAKREAEEARERAAEHAKALEITVRQARAALAKQYENRIATLESELEACKGQLRDDDEIVEALHQRIDVLEKQGSSADGDAARLAAAESRAKTVEQECARLGTAVLELERDKADLERRLEEAEARANALASQHAALSAREGTGSEASLRAQLTELQARLSSADEQRCASLRGDQERLEKLEQERKLFKIEQRKRQAEREAMIEKLGELAAENKHLTEKLADAQRCASSAESALRETTHPEFTNKIEAAQAEARGLRQELGTREAECAELRAQAAQLAAAAQSAKQEGAAIKDKAKQKLALASAQISKVKEEYQKLLAVFQAQVEANQTLRESGRAQHDRLEAAMREIRCLRRAAQDARDAALALRPLFADMAQKQLGGVLYTLQAQWGAERARLETLYRREAAERRRLHNVVQELKGNIRVYCRVRPLSATEQSRGEGMSVSVSSECDVAVTSSDKGTQHQFEFDHVFPPAYSQERVFEQVAGLVQSVLDGFNVCIFAYGQTGSGKTHTMQGPSDDAGVNTRALALLFELGAQVAQNGSFSVSVSLLEVYNESLRDLLGAGADKDEPLRITQNANGVQVLNLKQVGVSSHLEVDRVLQSGMQRRAVAGTNMNERSSRSHLVLTVYTECANATTGVRTVGKLHLVDLAGSERVSRSGASGERFAEATHINASLTTLGMCISARANGQSHVPFRNSVLTHLLQDSLSANSKTLMIVHVSPAASDSSETINSLRFAEHARRVELGPAKRNTRTAVGPASPRTK